MKELHQFNYELNLNDILKVLHNILDKLDKQPSQQRDRFIKVPIDENNFPSLYFPLEFDDDKKLISAIKVLIKQNIFQIEESRKNSFRELNEKENAKLVFNYDWEESLRIFYNRKIVKDDWNDIVNSLQLDEHIKTIILNNKIAIKGKTNIEIIYKLVNLLTNNHVGKSIRHVSAKYFWGLSKVLDNKNDIIEQCKLKAMPIILHVKSFNNDFQNILFVENLDTYNEITVSNNPIFKKYLIIYSSGFKASAKRLRTIEGSRLYFEDNCLLFESGRKNFKNWLYQNKKLNLNVYFWGDLDYSGINIFSTLKNIFPELKIWSTGYNKLLSAANNGDAHSPQESNKEGQVITASIYDEYVNTVLIPILKKDLFVDQELVDIENLEF